MNIDAIGLVPMPAWSGELRRLYWKVRACRKHSVPSKGTLYRQIRGEKTRLLEQGVCRVELHHVCRILGCDRFLKVRQWNAERRYVDYLVAKQKGTLRW